VNTCTFGAGHDGAIAGDIIGSRSVGHPGPLSFIHAVGSQTTVCSLAIADALLGNRDFAAYLSVHVRRHPGRGYG